MAQCESPRCGKSWDPPNGHFPLCITNPCPLRQLQRKIVQENTGKSLFQTSANSGAVPPRVATQIGQSLESLRNSCKAEFKLYDMQGKQSAETTVTLNNGQIKSFKTKNLMHSEMVAIEWMVENGYWTIYLGNVVWAADGSLITSAQFSTAEPHCGFCTIFLIAAGLPVGKPTCGNYKLAYRFSYQLPYGLETSPHFMARVLDNGCYCGFPAIKRALNAFINVPSNEWVLSIGGLAYVNDLSYINPDSGLMVVDWLELVNMYKREVIYFTWKAIFKQLLATNKNHK